MTIPKIIHQVWEGRTEPSIPARLQILARTWKEKNPDWEYHLWNKHTLSFIFRKLKGNKQWYNYPLIKE